MTNHTKEQNIEELLPRYCEGKTTSEENRLIQGWIESDENNRKQVDKIKRIYLASDMLYVLEHVNTEKALKKVKAKMHGKKKNWLKLLERIAAILVLPLLISTFIMLQKSIENAGSETKIISLRTNPGMTAEIMLPDNTKVYLNSETEISYPNNFDEKHRTVDLNGEAYFEVTPDKKREFIVNTKLNSKIRVYGTKFNIDAYEDNSTITTTLVEGSVGFEWINENGAESRTILTPKHKIMYNNSTKEINYQSTACEVETAWKDGKIIFDNTSLTDILNILEKRFNVEFIIKNKSLLNNRFTGTFSSQRLERILEFFKISSKIRWRYIENDNINDKKQKIEIY